MSIKAPKGCRDIYGKEAKAFRYLESKFSQLAELFGFQEIRMPSFEYTELFSRGVGEETDIVSKEMYTFLDKGGRSLTLRPEGTAGVVRAYLEHGLAAEPSPLKLYYMINAFRYERPQKGRYREFQQFGMELFGSADPAAEADILSFLNSYFKLLGLEDCELLINSIGCSACRPKFQESLKGYLSSHRGDLCEDCAQRMERNPLRCLDCKQEACQTCLRQAPFPTQYLCEDCAEHYAEVKALLTALEINFKEDPQLVRGLDYYTRTVFEFHASGIGAQSAICGGGRYDNLVSSLGGPETPAVGFAFGVERLRMEMEARGLTLAELATPQLQIITFPETKADGLALAADLRQDGVYVETDLMGRSFKAQMKQANRLAAEYLLVYGESELGSSELKLRRMFDGEEILVARAALSDFLNN